MQPELIKAILDKIKSKTQLAKAKVSAKGNFDIDDLFGALHEMFSMGGSVEQNIWRNSDWGEGKYEIYHEVRYFEGKRNDRSIWIIIQGVGKLAPYNKDVLVFNLFDIKILDYDEQKKEGKLKMSIEVYTNYQMSLPNFPLVDKIFKKFYENIYDDNLSQLKGWAKKKHIPSIINTIMSKLQIPIQYSVG